MYEQLRVWINGKFYPRASAKVSVFDHGFLYGDGVFEAIRCYEGNIFMLEEYINRLFDSARYIHLEIGIKKEKIMQHVIDTLKVNQLRNAYIRVVVTRGEGPMGVDPRHCGKPTIVIITEPRSFIFNESGISAKIVSVRRVPKWALDPRAKTLNYLNNVLARIEAIAAGADNAIMLDEQGYVTEACTENVFMVRKANVYTPPLSTDVLEGVTRRVVIRIVKELGIKILEKNITPYDLYNAEEIFLTGTAAGIVPIVLIDGRRVGKGRPGPLYNQVKECFLKITKDPHWGTPVY